MSGVEFLPPDDADSADEELLVEPPRRTRPWWILGVLALVVAAAAWTLTRPTDHGTPAPQALPTAQVPITAPITTAASSDRDARACQPPFCAASVVVPSELRRAIQHYLPQVTTIEVRSYVSRPNGSSYLADRDINALAGSVSVLISLHRSVEPTSTPSAIVTAPAGVGSVLLHSMMSGFTIDLQYLAPETVPPSLARLQLLTMDPRLESL